MREGWSTNKLSEVIIRAGTIDPRKEPERVFHYIDVSSVSRAKLEIAESSEILGKDAPSRARRLIHEDDVLFATIRPTLKRVAVVPKKLDGEVCSTGYFVFRTKPELDNKYLFYYLLTDEFMERMERLQSGASYPAVNDSQVKQQKISYPHLEEQKRIVAILDEAFTGIDSAIANTEKNLANARKLFDSYLNSVFTQKGEGWIEKQLGDVCSITSKLVDPRDDKFIDLKHVGAGNIISFTGDLIQVQTARDEGLISGKFVFDEHMVLYSKIRPYLMKVVRPGFVGLCSADIYPLKPFADFLDRDFLYYLLLSNKFTKYAISGSERAGMPKVNREHLFQYSVALPEFSEQKRIAEQLDTMAIESQRIEIIYKQKLNSLKELKQSLLQKAFSGELTAAKATPEAILKEEEVA